MAAAGKWRAHDGKRAQHPEWIRRDQIPLVPCYRAFWSPEELYESFMFNAVMRGKSVKIQGEVSDYDALKRMIRDAGGFGKKTREAYLSELDRLFDKA